MLRNWLIGGFAVFGVISFVGIGALFWWIETGEADRLAAEGNRLRAEGTALGVSEGDRACVAESAKRINACPGSMCQGSVVAAFTASCFYHSDRTPGLCNEFPDRETVEGTDWSSRYCDREGYEEDMCWILVPYIWSHCRADMYRGAGGMADRS